MLRLNKLATCCRVIIMSICFPYFHQSTLAGDTSPWAWAVQQSQPLSELERESNLDLSSQVNLFRFNNHNDRNGKLTLSSHRLPLLLASPSDSLIDFNKYSNKQLQDCIEPSILNQESFFNELKRKFDDSSDQLERKNLLNVTLKRLIFFNKLILTEVNNLTNYQSLKSAIGNYHTINAKNVWYLDITDCELGLIKYYVFKIFHLLDKQMYESAYNLIEENNKYFPLSTATGFEQLANILLIRLFDRFKGDDKINQLFRWPVYFKQLAAYGYSRKQMLQPHYDSNLQLTAFAYPTYYRDIKYNFRAINRTHDNIDTHNEHEKFNLRLNRKFSDRNEKNVRYEIFRQRQTLISLLTKDLNVISSNFTNNEWVKAQQENAKLSATKQASNNAINNDIRITRFSDLTDEEFVAYLNDDKSALLANPIAKDYLINNFPIEELTDSFRDEIAFELNLRLRLLKLNSIDAESMKETYNGNRLTIARQVVDDLISSVGLPMGFSNTDNQDTNGGKSESEVEDMFRKVMHFFKKTYSSLINSRTNSKLLRVESRNELTESDISDERQRRQSEFLSNYPIISTWFKREGWLLRDNDMVLMLRLADMSWPEIKFTLFKVCCLDEVSLANFAQRNASIDYLSSNSFLCDDMSIDWTNTSTSKFKTTTEPKDQTVKQTATPKQQQDTDTNLSALEVYFYYCVHFYKHHSNLDEFTERFNIFRRNVESIRQFSCQRSETLYNSMNYKLTDTLNTIDVMDPLRRYTDDLNLDRFEYFSTIPGISSKNKADRTDSAIDKNILAPYEQTNRKQQTNFDGQLLLIPLTRAAISYRREAFTYLISRQPSSSSEADTTRTQIGSTSLKRILDSYRNARDYRKYEENNGSSLYKLVVRKYVNCMKLSYDIDLDETYVKQQCQSFGPLADQIVSSQINWHANIFNSASLKAREQDKCAYYRLGLESWSEGLTPQSTFDVMSAISCN